MEPTTTPTPAVDLAPAAAPAPPPRALPTTMRTAHCGRYGEPREVVEVRDAPVPTPGAGQVLVRVEAASVNAADWHFTTGEPMFSRLFLGLRRPSRSAPGSDVSGVVVAVGDGVTRWSVGDEVFGDIEGGAFAQYAVAREDHLVARAGLGAEEAATLGVAAETALQGLRDWGRLTAGERVLVNGASGGVGTFAVQLAKALGAGHVTAVCSTANVETARSLGADVVVDYRTEPFASVGGDFDVYYDNAGSQPLADCRDRLAPGGRYVMVTSPKSRWLKPIPRILAGPVPFVGSGRTAVIGKVADRSPEDLALVRDHVLAGRVRPVLERRWSLEEVAEALHVQGGFHARGKSLVVP